MNFVELIIQNINEFYRINMFLFAKISDLGKEIQYVCVLDTHQNMYFSGLV